MGKFWALQAIEDDRDDYGEKRYMLDEYDERKHMLESMVRGDI